MATSINDFAFDDEQFDFAHLFAVVPVVRTADVGDATLTWESGHRCDDTCDAVPEKQRLASATWVHVTVADGESPPATVTIFRF